ncbi:MAG: CPBP family intramembrane metalloprotease [Chloroflexi bacterium]|nr:CPBP family intramembrane metalloprotease [Chloroflexota bacterium]
MLRRTWVFFILTYAISWLLWLPGVLRSNGYDDLPEIVGLPGMFAVLGPTIAAFILVGRESGRAGVSRLLRRAFQTGFGKGWWLPTLLLMPVIGLLTAGILLLLGERTPDWSAPTLLTALGTAVFILLIGGGLEEFGWRGYALDRMQTGKNAVVASLVLGFFWGMWHLPLFFIESSTQYRGAIPLWEFVLQIMVLSVLFTWLYNNTQGSLLVAILFHTIGNTTAALLPPYFSTEIGRWIYFSLLLITALIVVLVWGWRTLNRGRPLPQPSLPEQI